MVAEESFYSWSMENGYDDNLSIDRIDVNGNYTPMNCRWANIYTQANNKTCSAKITYNGKTYTIKEWADITGLKYDTLFNRLRYLGWSVEDSLLTPLGERPVSLH